MPLLRRQPFSKEDPPPDLKASDEVYFCKLTGEIFLDYEKFFERIILCNSLVWTCELTGKSGLTFQEALDSEEKAGKRLATIPDALQKPILYLASLTHRSRLNDLNDDIYCYVKDRYFVGEMVEVVQSGEKKRCKVVKVIGPVLSAAQNGTADNTPATSDSDSDVVCLDDPPKPVSPKKAKSPKADKEKSMDPLGIEYVVQEHKKNTIYIVTADHVSRKWGTFTREKSKMYLKHHCASTGDGIWKVKEKFAKKFKLSEISFSEIFDGPCPTFQVSQCKKRPPGSRSGSYIDLTDEDRAIKQAKLNLKDKKKRLKELKKQDKKLEKIKDKAAKKRERRPKSKNSREEKTVEPNFDELRKMSLEERQAFKEKLKLEKMALRMVQKEEIKKKQDEEKLKKKEEREKEREKKKKVPTATLR